MAFSLTRRVWTFAIWMPPRKKPPGRCPTWCATLPAPQARTRSSKWGSKCATKRAPSCRSAFHSRSTEKASLTIGGGLPRTSNSDFHVDNSVNQHYIHISPCRHEGRFAIVTKRGAGCDGRLPRQAGSFLPGENAAAYGEVVWFWRRDP